MGVLKVNVGTDVAPEWRKIGCGGSGGTAGGSQSFTFNGTGAAGTGDAGLSGSAQDFVVPAGVTVLTVELWGGSAGGVTGGGYLKTDLAVTPGETLKVYCGGQGGAPNATTGTYPGGWNGGGSGGPNNGTGGGGATDIRRSPYALADRLAVAGGAGGNGSSGGGAGGAGGGTTGGTGGSYGGGSTGGTGGTSGAGGTAGANPSGGAGFVSTAATAGTSGQGGAGGNLFYTPTGVYVRGGGGGGGGYYGGGGGGSGDTSGNASSGGGGGSSYSSGTVITNTAGAWSGSGGPNSRTDGKALLSWAGTDPSTGRLKLWTPAGWLVEACDDSVGTARPLKLNVGPPEAPDWVTVACMVFSADDATAGVYDTATFDYSVYG